MADLITFSKILFFLRKIWIENCKKKRICRITILKDLSKSVITVLKELIQGGVFKVNRYFNTKIINTKNYFLFSAWKTKCHLAKN